MSGKEFKMAKVKGKIKSIHSKKQLLVLGALERAAKKLGLKVSAGKLQFAGLKLKGGNCLFKGEKWLVFDRNQPFEDVVEIYRQAVNPHELAACELEAEDKDILSPYFLSEIQKSDQVAEEILASKNAPQAA